MMIRKTLGGRELVSWVVPAAVLFGAVVPAFSAAAPDDKRVQIEAAGNACSLRYLESGPMDGLPVVLLHGARFTADTWVKTKTLSALEASGFHVYAIDLPGFGKTKCPEAKADVFLKQLFESLGITKPVLVSPSMSGRFSLPLVTVNPELLAGFVAVAPVGIPRFEKKLSSITIPTLAIWGEKDRVVPVAHAEMLAKAIKNTHKVILKGARHPSYLDASAKFNAELVTFVTKCSTSQKD
jgi:abhydrolase domain-containing protein 14